jgi:hypothetical protein
LTKRAARRISKAEKEAAADTSVGAVDTRAGVNKDGLPNAFWRRFKKDLDKYADVPVKDWQEKQVLGHIMKRYKDLMGIDFSLSYVGAPGKSKEIFCIRKLMLNLGTEDGIMLKRYIDWVFDTIIVPKGVTLTSIAYFFVNEFILAFKKELNKSKPKVTRATDLPDDIKTCAANLSLDIKTYGDLAFAKVALREDPGNKDLEKYFDLFVELRRYGFDDSVLGSLE